MSITLTDARIVTPDEVHEGWLTIENGRITHVGRGKAPGEGHSLSGGYVVPGFVDIHNHGGDGGSYPEGDLDGARRAAALHARHGTTTTIASLVTAAPDDLARAAAALADLCEEGVLAGIHYEGPYISPARRGAHDPALLRTPDRSEFASLIKAGRGHIRMITIAPELPGAPEVIRAAADAGVIAAIGHCDATYEQTLAGIDAGATVATHLYNTMPALHHRNPGPIAALLEDERVTVELINDGTHLHPAALQFAFHHAGRDRVAFITDAMDAAGFGDGRYMLGPLEVEVADGVARLVEGNSIAGSTLTLDRAFKRAVTVDGLPVEDVVAAVSANPARLLGLSDRIGSLEPGKDADLVVLDDSFELVGVMRKGEWAVAPQLA